MIIAGQDAADRGIDTELMGLNFGDPPARPAGTGVLILDLIPRCGAKSTMFELLSWVLSHISAIGMSLVWARRCQAPK